MKIELDNVPFIDRFISDILLKAIHEKANVNLEDLYLNKLDILTSKESGNIMAYLSLDAVISKKELTKLMKEAFKDGSKKDIH